MTFFIWGCYVYMCLTNQSDTNLLQTVTIHTFTRAKLRVQSQVLCYSRSDIQFLFGFV